MSIKKIENLKFLNKNKSLCLYPWTNLEVTPSGRFKTCCVINQPISNNGKIYNVNDIENFSIKDVYFSDQQVKLRQDFLEGKQPECCSKCWTEESTGKQSDRQLYYHHMKRDMLDLDFQTESISNLISLDLKLGNLCNLSCVTCEPLLSSTRATEEMRELPVEEVKTSRAYILNSLSSWPKNKMKFWDELITVLPNVKFLQITGGEPLMSPYQFEVLKIAVDQGVAGNIEIRYNSNGTIYPEQAPDIWKHFKRVKIGFSIDDINDRFEYQRYGAKWESVLVNLEKFNKLKSTQFTTEVACLVNIQNVLYLPEFCEWYNSTDFDSVWFNILHGPEELSIKNLTATAKELILDKLHSTNFQQHQYQIDSFITAIDTGTVVNGEAFSNYIRKLDVRRNLDFSQAHPEIALAMGYVK